MKLTNVTIHKYKSYESDQAFDVDSKVTILVGKNEAGKTAALEAISKTRYFIEDAKFKFDPTHDYPRKEKKRYDKSGEIGNAVTCTYELTPEEAEEIDSVIGKEAWKIKKFSVTTTYDNKRQIGGISPDRKRFLSRIALAHALSPEETKRLVLSSEKSDLDALRLAVDSEYKAVVAQGSAKAAEAGTAPQQPESSKLLGAVDEIVQFFSKAGWQNWLGGHIWDTYISNKIPKFMYFAEYYELPARIDIGKISRGEITTDQEKTAKALFELADINADDILASSNFEGFVAELEATANEVTRQLFTYWKNNTGLRIQFYIEPEGSQRYLNVRVWNDKHLISLPLSNRSKGFNWFFSFIVWFSRIQEDKGSEYILVLDEPGLNLHATAQADLLAFLESLCGNYQIIYTTHSPFMVDPNHLGRVRTVFEAANGTEIKEAIQQRDSDTLFPLQAALGYDIAQNLFISKNNLLVEGPSDMIYLTMMSAILESDGRVGLRDDLTLVPVGGLDKVVSFISLLRGNKLNIACLLDTFTDQKGKRRVDDPIQEKIIKAKNVRFFDEFDSLKGDVADLEDLFEKAEYVNFFSLAFPEHPSVQMGAITDQDGPILKQISSLIGKPRFNHYRPAMSAGKLALSPSYFATSTLGRFEEMFKVLNGLF